MQVATPAAQRSLQAGRQTAAASDATTATAACARSLPGQHSGAMAATAAAAPSDDLLGRLAQAGSLSQGLLAEAAGGSSLRNFTFGIDLQHFAAGSRLPLNLAMVALELELPAEFAGWCLML